MATIKDVAKRAGVAVSTASSALSGKSGVSAETRRRTLEAADELGYVPNPAARGLVTGNTTNVGIVLSGPPSLRMFTNPAFIEMVRLATTTISENDYHALLNILTTEDEAERLPRIAQSRYTEALILIGTRRDDPGLSKMLRQANVPAVVTVRGRPDARTCAVAVDNRKCGYLATQHLIELGHESIGYIGHLPEVSLADEREAGYRQALEEAGLSYDEQLVVTGDFYQESGFSSARQLLERTSGKLTAIFAANDLMALGAIEALEQKGFRLPEDMSVVGCDDIPNLHLLEPPLTTVSLPYAEIGRLAAEKVIGILEGDDRLPSQVTLDTQLVVRGSTTEPPDS